MPAKSKAQQRFFGAVHRTQKGKRAPSKAVANAAKSIGKGAVKDFASTKHIGLPEKKPKKKKYKKAASTAFWTGVASTYRS